MQQFERILQNRHGLSEFFYVIKDKDFLFNVPSLKEYIAEDGTKKYKLVLMHCVKNRDVESSPSFKSSSNDSKLENNLARSRDSIYQYAYCNKWDFFVTITLDKSKIDRNNISLFNKTFNNAICYFNKKNGCNVKFLLIPELHKKGGFHLHGLLAGLPGSLLTQFKLGDKMGFKIAERVSQGVDVFHWSFLDNKFGFNELEKIRNKDAVSCYITKYITKDLLSSVKTLNAHVYYCSKGLKRAKIMDANKIDLSLLPQLKPSYSNKYCDSYWLSEKELNFLSHNNL